jgi:hypothetical protein
LAIFDEAHKLAAHFLGSKLEKTGRFKLAEKLGAQTRHLFLMTATPHNGKEEDSQLFLSLLDSDRFYGKFRDGVHKVDCSDLIRRMVKEKLVKFDGTPLFPERRAYTVNYQLSDLEYALYEAVTQYVKTEMGKADHLDGQRKGAVGFALTALQRRLASSPEAIFQSLKRRRERLERRLREETLGHRGPRILAETLADVPEDDEDLNAEEQENLEETLVDQATASQTISELAAEIIIRCKASNSGPRTWSPPARTGSGTSCPAFFGTSPSSTTAVGACARSSSSASTATPSITCTRRLPACWAATTPSSSYMAASTATTGASRRNRRASARNVSSP